MHRSVCLIVLVLASILVCATVGQHDQTLSSGARGAGVVEAVCSRLEASRVFSDDKLFTRRLAYVESYDGEHPDAFRPGYYGGIWQVDQNMFALTQDSSTSSVLGQTIKDIKVAFGIDWKTVVWEDLTKPLHSALAVRLYLLYSTRNAKQDMPRSIGDQADYWAKYYRPSGNKKTFSKEAQNLKQDIDDCDDGPCLFGQCNDQVDGYVCHCFPGYTGKHCDVAFESCETVTCVHGTCEDGDGYFVCHCEPGWIGRYCDRIPRTTPYPPTPDPTATYNTATIFTGTRTYTHSTTTTEAPSQGGPTYNCVTNSPCTQENIDAGRVYFPHDDPSKFVKCDEWGQCFEMSCPPGLIWDDDTYTCNRP